MDEHATIYTTALRQTLRTTAAAYGYALSIATTMAILTSVHGRPHAGQLFAFVAGALIAFAVLEAFLLADHAREAPSGGQAFRFAGALNCFSVAAALGAAIGIAHALTGLAGWFVAPFAATAVYLLVVAVQVRIVEGFRAADN